MVLYLITHLCTPFINLPVKQKIIQDYSIRLNIFTYFYFNHFLSV